MASDQKARPRGSKLGAKILPTNERFSALQKYRGRLHHRWIRPGPNRNSRCLAARIYTIANDRVTTTAHSPHFLHEETRKKQNTQGHIPSAQVYVHGRMKDRSSNNGWPWHGIPSKASTHHVRGGERGVDVTRHYGAACGCHQ